ncbi:MULTISPECIES: ATP-binding protein [Streptomyces]|uniref:ATP-binding protein n=1 Tax=Streptomyces galilaeus TaxID=33899 RepID=A0ABW9IKX9_STRGJ
MSLNQQLAVDSSAAVVPATETSANQEPLLAAITLLPLESQDQPAFRWNTTLLANEGAGPNARLRARPWLTTGHWSGDIDIAARVADKIVDNAVRHGRPFADGCVPLRLIVDASTHELLVEVDDAYPEFPGFERVANQYGKPSGRPSGLWWVAHYRGRVSWDVKRGGDGVIVGKTVQAILPAG